MITPKYFSPTITQLITMGDNFSPRPIPPRIIQRKLSSMITPVKPLDDNFSPYDHQKSKFTPPHLHPFFFLKNFIPRLTHLVTFCFRLETLTDFVKFRSSRQKIEDEDGILMIDVISEMIEIVEVNGFFEAR